MSILKAVDGYFGRFAVALLARPSQPPPVALLKRILIIRPGGIGDAAMLIPAILALKLAFPEAIIDVLAEKRNMAVFSLCAADCKVIAYDNPWDLVDLLLSRYDAVIDTEQWHRLSAVVARLTRAPMLIGFGTNERKKLYTHPVSYSHGDYEVNSFFSLLEPFGIKKKGRVEYPYLNVPGIAQKKAEEMLGDLVGKKFVTLFPGSSIPEKRWDIEKFAALASILHQKGIVVVTLGIRDDFVAGERIANGKSDLNLAGMTTLAETAAIINKGRVLVSGDSGILHLGVGLGTPTVSLFGPSNVDKWAPKGNEHTVITTNHPCSPCSQFGYTPKCPINIKCMAEILVDEVARAVLMLIGEL